MAYNRYRQRSASRATFPPTLIGTFAVLALMLTGVPLARSAQPLQDMSLRAVQIPGIGGARESSTTKGQSSKQDQTSTTSSDAEAEAALAIPPALPPSISTTVTNRQQRLFEENPQGLIPPATERPQTFALPPALQLSIPGAYGTARVDLTPQAVDNAQSEAIGNGVLIHNDTRINSITIQNAQDVGHHNLGDIGVHNLQVKGTIKITPSK